MQFSMLETLESLEIEISEKEYRAQYANAQNQLDGYEDDSGFGEFEKREYVDADDKLTRTSTYFTLGCADLILTKLECKDGYYFNTKRSKK